MAAPPVQDKQPKFIKVEGKRVRSWAQEALVGTSREQFRAAAERIIQDTPNHPLKPLLGPKGRFKNPTAKGTTELHWLEDPTFVEAGHVVSKKSDRPEKLILMSTFKNRYLSSTIEHTSKGAHMEMEGRALAIGGVGVDLELAADLVKKGVLSQEVLDAAKVITF